MHIGTEQLTEDVVDMVEEEVRKIPVELRSMPSGASDSITIISDDSTILLEHAVVDAIRRRFQECVEITVIRPNGRSVIPYHHRQPRSNYSWWKVP
jgi:hypothetical protein